MALRSKLFRDDRRLQDCLNRDAAHVTPGSVGTHVQKIQIAVIQLDGTAIEQNELELGRYGHSTAAAVLQYKKKRNIVNRSYQSQADDIVGKMTIASLDKELLDRDQKTCVVVESITCKFVGPPVPVGAKGSGV